MGILSAIGSFIMKAFVGFISEMFKTPAVTTQVKNHEANINTDPKRDAALDRLRGSL
jgi:hypothetical protein